MNVAILGLGIIGSRASAHLRRHPDLQVRAWNRTPGRMPDQADSIAAAVHDAEAVSLYLKDAPATREAFAEIARHGPGTLTLLNHATIDLKTTRWLAESCAARGWNFLDAPFTGSREAAANAALVYYAAGDPSLVAHFEPFLLKTGKSVIRCGETGTATILKLVTNLVSACTVQALSEALATATRQGIAPEAFTAAISHNACASVLAAMKLPTMAAGNFETHFSLENMLKDSRYVLELAAGLETPAIRSVSERMARLCDEGHAQQDYSALFAPYLKS